MSRIEELLEKFLKIFEQKAEEQEPQMPLGRGLGPCGQGLRRGLGLGPGAGSKRGLGLGRGQGGCRNRNRRMRRFFDTDTKE